MTGINSLSEIKELRALMLALGLYVVVFGLKLVVYFPTGAMALLAEALHTLSDIFVSGFLLLALVWSRQEADAVHMFGYGRAQNVAALVAATLFISFTSFKLYEEALPKLFRPEQTTYQHLWLAVGIIILSMLIGIRLFAENLRMLVGRSPGPAFLASVENLARSVGGCGGFMSCEPSTSGRTRSQRACISRWSGASPLKRQIGLLTKFGTGFKRPRGAGAARSTWIP